jgi:hypothetical protein
MNYEMNVIQISQPRQAAATRHCHRMRRKFDCPDNWVITLSPQTGGPLSSSPNATGFIFWGFMQGVSKNTRSAHDSNWDNIQLCISDVTEGSIQRNA